MEEPALGDDTYTNGDGTALSALLGRQRVRLAKVGAPVASPDGNNAELRNDDGCPNGRCHFLGRLDTEANVAFRVTDDDDGLEPGSLTGSRLLLDGLDLHVWERLSDQDQDTGEAIGSWPSPNAASHLHDLVLELGEEEVDDLVLLDGERVQVNFLHALDLASLDEPPKLRDRLPFLLVALAAASPRSSSPSTATTSSATVASIPTARAKSGTTAAGASSSSISHYGRCFLGFLPCSCTEGFDRVLAEVRVNAVDLWWGQPVQRNWKLCFWVQP